MLPKELLYKDESLFIYLFIYCLLFLGIFLQFYYAFQILAALYSIQNTGRNPTPRNDSHRTVTPGLYKDVQKTPGHRMTWAQGKHRVRKKW